MSSPVERGPALTRRRLLQAAGFSVLAAAAACRPEEKGQAPVSVTTSTPEPSTRLSVAERVLLPAKVAQKIEEERRETAAPTPTENPLIPRQPLLKVATQTPEIIRTPEPLQIGLMWNKRITESVIARQDETRQRAPSFVWNGNSLFTVNEQGIPVEIDLDTGKESGWKWQNQGYVVGVRRDDLINSDIVVLAHRDTPRIYFWDIKSNRELWRHNLSNLIAASGPNWITQSGMKAPFYNARLAFAIQFERGFYLSGSVDDPGQGIEGYLLNLVNENVIFQQGQKLICADAIRKSIRWSISSESSMADGETVVTSTPSAGSSTSKNFIRATDIAGGTELWKTELPRGAKPAFIGKNFIVIGNGFSQESYFLLDRRDGSVVSQGVHPASGYNFFEKGDWFFISHPQTGTEAFFEKAKKWQNDEVPGAFKCLTEIQDSLILTRGGSGTLLGGTQINGVIWAVEKESGKLAPWPPVYFDPFTTSSLLIDNKAIVADGVFGERFALKSLDLSTGEVRVISDKPGHGILNITDVGRGIVVGQIIGGKIFAARVTENTTVRPVSREEWRTSKYILEKSENNAKLEVGVTLPSDWYVIVSGPSITITEDAEVDISKDSIQEGNVFLFASAIPQTELENYIVVVLDWLREGAKSFETKGISTEIIGGLEGMSQLAVITSFQGESHWIKIFTAALGTTGNSLFMTFGSGLDRRAEIEPVLNKIVASMDLRILPA